MTGSIAIARALAQPPGGGGSAWPRVTHLTTGSGSSWFSSQFCYGEAFHEAVTSDTVSVHSFIEQWAQNYSLRLLGEQAGGVPLKPLHGRCHVADAVLDKLATWAFDHTKMPSTQWEPYTATILRDEVDHLTDRRFGVRSGLRTATLMQMLSLSPDSYLSKPDGSLSRINLLANGQPIQYAVPLAFAADAHGRLEWSHHVHAHVNLSITSDEPGLPDHPLILPSDPAIRTVTAGSSAALGALSSYDMVMQMTPRITHWIVKDCLEDTGLEGLGVPMNGAASLADYPTYRFLDGGYTDNSAVGMAVARMQRDCGYSAAATGFTSTGLDCSATPTLIIVDHDKPGRLSGFSSERLFRPPAGTGIINHWSPPDPHLLAPLASIFAEAYPNTASFLSYGAHGVSQFWNGTVTTIDNAWYGVKGGMIIRVALVNPQLDVPLTPGQTVHGLFTRDDAVAYARLFTQTYASLADEQAAAVAPLLHTFLEET